MKTTIGLTALLCSCPKHQQSAYLYQPAQTVAQFLILNGERTESLYEKEFETDVGTLLVAYDPEGEKSDFADDILVIGVPVPSLPDTLYGDVGLDGTVDFFDDARESSPARLFSFLPDSEKAELTRVYTRLIDLVAAQIKAHYNMKQLEEVQPL